MFLLSGLVPTDRWPVEAAGIHDVLHPRTGQDHHDRPQMLAKVAYDDNYNDLPRMMDLSKLLRRDFRLLAAAGCRNLPIDESLFKMYDDWEVDAAVDAINTAIEGLPDDIHVSTHICQGNYAAGTEYDERTIITSSCGFNHLPRQSAIDKARCAA